MTTQDIIDALTPLFSLIWKKPLSAEQWDQYHLALGEVNTGDLDDAIASLRTSHAFHRVPLPADVMEHVNRAKQRRVAAMLPVDKTYKADPSEGEWKTFTLPGIGSMRMHVLPDDHPALKRYACLECKDSGWREVPAAEGAQMTVTRCGCWKHNPVIQRERESNARYVKERGER